jgi:hypothetical protein
MNKRNEAPQDHHAKRAQRAHLMPEATYRGGGQEFHVHAGQSHSDAYHAAINAELARDAAKVVHS